MGAHHWCEPDHFPTSLDQTWTCPECGRINVAFRLGDRPRPYLERLAGYNPDALGWLTEG